MDGAVAGEGAEVAGGAVIVDGAAVVDGTVVDGAVIVAGAAAGEGAPGDDAPAGGGDVITAAVDGAELAGVAIADVPHAQGPAASGAALDVAVVEYGSTESGALFDVEIPVRLSSAISPSRAGDFMQCPLLYRLRVVDKVPEPPNAAAVRGTLVHAVLDRLFDVPAGERTPDQAAALLQPEWERLLAKDPNLVELFETPQEAQDWLASAKSLVGRYFTLEDPNRLEPARREWFVRTVIGEGEDRFVLQGVVDRLDVAPNGLLRVVDYKTGKAPAAQYEGKNLFQMKFYALVLWKSRGVVPKRLQLLFLGSGDVLTYDPEERDLRAVERKITAVWAAIRAAAQRREWPASPSRLCDWCSFKDGCPAHGGELPPAPVVEFTPVS